MNQPTQHFPQPITDSILIAGEKLGIFTDLLHLEWLDPLIVFEDAQMDEARMNDSWTVFDIYSNRGNEPALTLFVQQRPTGVYLEITSHPGGRLVESFGEYLGKTYRLSLPTLCLSDERIDQADSAILEIKPSKSREPNEHDRIRTTLMTWAVKTGKYPSYAQARTQLGSIHVDTRRNHENDGWFYSDEEMEAKGGFEYLWTLYTTEFRKS